MFRHVLICGLGSIGRRHLRHLRDLGVRRIDAYRTGKATLADEGQPAPDHTYARLDEALAQGPEAVVVANPTALHVPTARRAVAAGCHVLIEKPLSHDLAGCEELAAEAEAASRIVSVAQNLRHHPALLRLKAWIDSETPLGKAMLLRAHFGAYLPAWHPWEDYRRSYAARRDLGGGARRTHIHEVDYAVWLLGEVAEVVSLEAGLHPLGTDVDEISGLLLRHAGGALSALTLSLAERPPGRTVEVAFSDGRASLDLMTGRLCSIGADGVEEEVVGADAVDVDATYREQLLAFAQAALDDGPAPVPVREAAAVLRAATAS